MNEMSHALARQHHYLVPDVRCAGCCLKIEREVSALPGVDRVNVNYADKRLSFQAETGTDPATVIQRVESLGYSVSPDSESEGLRLFRDQRRAMLARLGVAGIGMMQVMMFALATYLAGPGGIEASYEVLMRWASLVIAVPVVFYAAQPFHRGAIRDLRNLSPGMDVPVSLAICAAFSLSAWNTLFETGEVYFDSACMFTFFLLLGRYLELSARHSFQVEQSLGEHLLPPSAIRADGTTVPLDILNEGDLLVVTPGQVVPADGIVVEGASSIDESAFTGESNPETRHVGSRVLAGSENLDGRIVIRVEGAPDSWVISHLGELYRQSAAYRPRVAMLADVIARYFVTIVLTLSLGSGLYWWLQGSTEFFAIALAVLVVSCPCALSLATPVAYSIASGAVRDLGVLVKAGEFLEKLGKTTTVVFDKTGTLTEGCLRLGQVLPIEDGLATETAIGIAAALEQESLHPIATTLRQVSPEQYQADDLQVMPGMGVTGIIDGCTWRFGRPGFASGEQVSRPDGGHSWALLSRDKRPVCWFEFLDQWRAGAGAAIDGVRNLGVEVCAFSGDSSEEGREGLRGLGIDSPVMNMSPDEKIHRLGLLQENGARVLMVGDGLNDAGAMARADIAMAVNPVDTLVQSAADAVLVNGDMSAIPRLIRYARRVRRIVGQNLGWALVYNLTVIPLAIMGLVAPWVAALGMSMSSLFVTLNACRLGRVS